MEEGNGRKELIAQGKNFNLVRCIEDGSPNKGRLALHDSNVSIFDEDKALMWVQSATISAGSGLEVRFSHIRNITPYVIVPTTGREGGEYKAAVSFQLGKALSRELHTNLFTVIEGHNYFLVCSEIDDEDIKVGGTD